MFEVYSQSACEITGPVRTNRGEIGGFIRNYQVSSHGLCEQTKRLLNIIKTSSYSFILWVYSQKKRGLVPPPILGTKRGIYRGVLILRTNLFWGHRTAQKSRLHALKMLPEMGQTPEFTSVVLQLLCQLINGLTLLFATLFQRCTDYNLLWGCNHAKYPNMFRKKGLYVYKCKLNGV